MRSAIHRAFSTATWTSWWRRISRKGRGGAPIKDLRPFGQIVFLSRFDTRHSTFDIRRQIFGAALRSSVERRMSNRVRAATVQQTPIETEITQGRRSKVE